MKHQSVIDQCTLPRQSGLTIVELLISATLGLVIALAAMALLLSSKNAYIAQEENVGLQDTGRYAIESITRAIHQAAYENWDKVDAPVVSTASLSASIFGLDSRSLKSATIAVTSPVKTAVNGSDVLAVRFFGVGFGTNGDGTIINCAGFGVAAPSADTAEQDRGWSIFYVAADSTGVPELRCKYKGKNSWSSEAIARGVESFQVLYGLDTDGDGLPNGFMHASDIDAVDDALILIGADAAAKALDKNTKTHWKKIVAIKVAMLVRGFHDSRADELNKQYDLFGAGYCDAYALTDTGACIKENTLPQKIRNRARKVFAATIQLRNQSLGNPA
jgi:type IV pilus assembly protein PilW